MDIIQKVKDLFAGQSTITVEFRRAQKKLPHLTASTKPIGYGAYGLVLEHDNATVSKILFKPSKPSTQERCLALWEREIAALHFMEKHPLQDIETPHIIDPPLTLDNNRDYMGSYKMTRVPGHTCHWHINKINEMHSFDAIVTKTEELYKNIGCALAKFHKALSQPLYQKFNQKAYYDGGEIIQSPKCSLPVNRALEKVNKYLQEHKHGQIIHGDFHVGNILADDSLNITGFIDFSYMGTSSNIAMDFRSITKEYRPFFIHGYEQESGEIIDNHLITAASLSLWTNLLSYYDRNKKADPYLLSKINEDLKEIKPITHYCP